MMCLMMMTIAELKNTLEKGIPQAQVTILDPQNDGVHLGARIVSPIFEGKNRLARHRIVYAALGNAFDGPLHALQLTTQTPIEAKET